MGCGYSKGINHYSLSPSQQGGIEQFILLLLFLFVGSLFFSSNNTKQSTSLAVNTSKEDTSKEDQENDSAPTSKDGLIPDHVHVKHS